MMHTGFYIFAAALFAVLQPTSALAHAPQDTSGWSIAIHGGAGTMQRERMTPKQQAEYQAALQRALDAGAQVLKEGGSALDAVKAAITPMEDDPRFNAGRGSVFTWEGANEMDAALMDGATRKAGAVTGVRTIRHPILLADAVMQDGRHVFLSGLGAEEFANGAGLDRAGPDWFATPRRKDALERLKAEQLSALDVDYKFGTVGAVVRDSHGNLAAGTSTGGLTGKRWGRIGDAPIIGAGTYADNRSCAVSATGAGEYFIRVGVAQEICTRLRLSEDPVSNAQTIADDVMAEIKGLGGTGGVILVTPTGQTIYSFNTQGMYRGRANSDGLNEVAIFKD